MPHCGFRFWRDQEVKNIVILQYLSVPKYTRWNLASRTVIAMMIHSIATLTICCLALLCIYTKDQLLLHMEQQLVSVFDQHMICQLKNSPTGHICAPLVRIHFLKINEISHKDPPVKNTVVKFSYSHMEYPFAQTTATTKIVFIQMVVCGIVSSDGITAGYLRGFSRKTLDVLQTDLVPVHYPCPMLFYLF